MELQKMEEQEGLEMLNGSVLECDKASGLEDGDPTAEVTAAEQVGFLPHAAGKKLNQFTDFEGKTSFGMSVFNLSNAIMGSGILGLAYAMSNTGIVLFIVLLICIAVLSAYSIHLLLKCAGVVGIRAYEQLGYRAFGPGGKVVAAVVICVHNTGAMSSYLYIVKYELPLVIQTFLGLSENTENWYMNGNVLIIIVSVCIILPLALMKHLGYLGYTSGLSLTCMVFFLISVIYKKFQISCPLNGTEPVTPLVYYNGQNASAAGTAGDECTVETFTVNSQTAYTIPILAFAFVCHPEVLPIYTELRRASKRRMQSVANVSVLAMFFMYLLTAVFGYLTFFGNVEPEMLHTYSKVDPLDRLILCVRLAVLMAVTLTVPVVLFPIRRAIQQLLFHGKDFSWVRHVSIAICLLFVVNLLVIFVPNIRDIFGVIGATSAPSLIFILPSIFYLRIVPREKEPLRSRPKIQAACFAALGFIFMVMSLGFIVADWVTTGRSSGGGH
ncbi:sodium-coupled neutral amino acid transporter 5-like [Mauremys mutica]|uniref:sodium-coupled neutral amino acid transporter 5-like n=1 Tax=Mauremys mutica TaxID=74926 RepID=UPI001D14615F|nr:sodium-coupled neutral amino acid transporter 5-like [Mauremys mutica]XP_044844014.1 sodium-coupled neutral amino acid transporter 5-like [Mauremys mutica]XP_044856249.1 sodium-coupled neutral amino acid transporter 5-like [Mauremys mutica]